MKSGKILFAILILFAFLKEGFRDYKQTGDIWFIIILSIVSLVLSGLLIKSAFKPRNLYLKENKFSIYFWKFLMVFSIFGLFSLLFNLGETKTNSNILEVNGIKIPLEKCIDNNIKVIKDAESTKGFCECLARKMVKNEYVVANYNELLIKGDLDGILKDIIKKNQINILNVDSCFSLINTTEWNEILKNSIKKEFKKKLVGTNFENTNDIEIYCDCIVEKFQKFPASRIISGSIFESKDWIEIDSICSENSKKRSSR